MSLSGMPGGWHCTIFHSPCNRHSEQLCTPLSHPHFPLNFFQSEGSGQCSEQSSTSFALEKKQYINKYWQLLQVSPFSFCSQRKRCRLHLLASSALKKSKKSGVGVVFNCSESTRSSCSDIIKLLPVQEWHSGSWLLDSRRARNMAM